MMDQTTMNLIKKLPCLLVLLYCSISAIPASSNEIFRIVDEAGRVTYSDRAPEGAESVTLPSRAHRRSYAVKSVYDGDTIILENGQRVRLLGINTPEIESRHRAAEAGGMAAKKWLQNQIKDNPIYLEYDQEKHDKYKRQLAHVFLRDGTHLNLELLKNGLAFVSIIPPNLRHAEAFVRAQNQAEKQKLGLWELPDYQIRPLDQIAAGHKGWQRYLITPRSIAQRRKFTYVTINEQLRIRIANDHLRFFPDLKTYLGKKLEIRGWVSRRGDQYTISVQHSSALVLL